MSPRLTFCNFQDHSTVESGFYYLSLMKGWVIFTALLWLNPAILYEVEMMKIFSTVNSVAFFWRKGIHIRV